MPRITLSTDNKSQNSFDYPTLKLDMNERARVLAIESDPEVEYVHTLKAPRITDGRVEYEEIKQRSGEIVRQPKMDFIGRHICLGSFDLLAQSGKDPKGCPVCRLAEKESIVDPAARRFAMHVVRYQLQPNSFNVSDPFGVAMNAWVFGDKVFNVIVDISEEWGDLRSHDLKLGPCTKPKYQQYEINVAQDAAWQASDERKKLTLETYKNGKCPDLSRLIGRKLSLEQVEQDLERVRQANREAFGSPSYDSDSHFGAAVDSPQSKPVPVEEVPAAMSAKVDTDKLDFEDLLRGL